jgi:hypothetical protein
VTSSAQNNRPWWTEWGLLLVIGLPAVTILACAITLTIAIRARDVVVSDDYYQQGLTINRSIQRDQVASQQGLSAALWIDAERGRLQVQLRRPPSAKPNPADPETLKLELVNSAHAGRDLSLTLQQDSRGLWFTSARILLNEPWDIVLESADWRLSARQVRLGSDPNTVVLRSTESVQ